MPGIPAGRMSQTADTRSKEFFFYRNDVHGVPDLDREMRVRNRDPFLFFKDIFFG